MMNDTVTVTIEAHPSEKSAEFLRRKMRESEQRLPPENVRPVALFLRNVRGDIVGGLLGSTRWNTLYINDLWVIPILRGKGYGRQLMLHCEAYAKTLGCRFVELGTFDFQARPFYEKLGYRVVSVKRGSPPGYESYWMQKDFEAQ